MRFRGMFCGGTRLGRMSISGERLWRGAAGDMSCSECRYSGAHIVLLAVVVCRVQVSRRAQGGDSRRLYGAVTSQDVVA